MNKKRFERELKTAVNDMTSAMKTIEGIAAEVEADLSVDQQFYDDLLYLSAQLMELREELVDVSGLNMLHRTGV